MSSLPLYRCQTESQPSYMSPGAEAQRGLMGQQSMMCPGHNAQSSLRGLCLRATRSGSMSQGPQLAAALRMFSASEKCWFKELFGDVFLPKLFPGYR